MNYSIDSEIIDLGEVSAFVNTTSVQEIEQLVEDITNDDKVSVKKFESGKYRGYVPWGADNQFPYKIMEAVRNSVVMSQNKHFNSLTCYGSGLTVKHENKDKKLNKEITDFFKYNRPARYFLEQSMDMKNWLWSVTVIIVNVGGDKIVSYHHKPAIDCRFETCNPKNGTIEHLFYGTFKDKTPKLEDLEVIPVLDFYDPIGDLEVRFGKRPNEKGMVQKPTEIRKFVIINRFPTAGDEKYYPFHPSWSVFNSHWYKYSQFIPIKKTAKLKNVAPIKYHVQIFKGYFEELFAEEGITTDEKKKERISKLKQEIKDFLTGAENSGKMWVSTFFVGHDGKEVSQIKITVIDSTKEGGELIDDSAEANNYLCYADAVHPALIGANPGQTQGNYSGSVQRELFTIKQALEKPYHDVLLEPFEIIKEFNGWKDVVFDIPVITLTTLDKGKDSEEYTMRNPENH